MRSDRNKKKKSPAMAFVWIGIIVCAAVMLYAGYQIYDDSKVYLESDKVYAALQDTVIADVDAAGMTIESMEGSVNTNSSRIDFDKLREISPDAIGWIYSKGTVINYPVMQSDDNKYYLKHLYDGTENGTGAIFLDYQAAPDFSSQNSTLYGHHMKNGKMFASFEGYKEQEYYDEHPVLELYTPNGDYYIELYGGYIVKGKGNAIPPEFESKEAFQEYLDMVKSETTFQSEVEVTTDDKIVTLCTCTYDYENARYILVGKLTPMA